MEATWCPAEASGRAGPPPSRAPTSFGRAVSEDVKAKVLQLRQGFVDDSLTLYRGPLKDNEGNVILKDGEVVAHDDNKFKLGMKFIVEGGIGKIGLKN
jgi:basic membrane protein A and related proteins